MIFYIVLALFAGGLFALFNTTLNDERPKWLLKESLIGDNPGLGFRPMPPDDNVDSTLIFFSNKEKWTDNWVKSIDEFLEREYSFVTLNLNYYRATQLNLI